MIYTDVLIIGAGPTGLSLAAQLLRYGISFVIVDKKAGVTNLSKALIVHARSLEIYDQLGLAHEAIGQGEIAEHVAVLRNGKINARLDLRTFGGELTAFPFFLTFEQNKNEQLLYDYLKQHGYDVQWQTNLQSLTQTADGVTAVLESTDGEHQTLHARYLVGCDGASSATRHLLNLEFAGSTFPRLFYVADVEAEFAADESTAYAAAAEGSFVLLFPLQGTNHWRLIGNMPEREQPKNESGGDHGLTYEELECKAQRIVQRPLNITKVRWFSSYNVHTRHANTFAKGRCFLAGDAAHVHTPAGGQGMNTGIQDAYNLAWKLALVLKGQAKTTLLDTYNEERLANAQQLLQTTDRFFDFAAGTAWYQRLFRDDIMPLLAKGVSKSGAAKQFLFPSISEIGIHYPNSSLSRHDGDRTFKVKAGDRMPYFQVDGANVYDRLRAPAFHLLIFSNNEHDYTELQAHVEKAYGERIVVHRLPLLPRVVQLFASNQPFTVLLRPDNYIAFLSAHAAVCEIATYIERL